MSKNTAQHDAPPEAALAEAPAAVDRLERELKQYRSDLEAWLQRQMETLRVAAERNHQHHASLCAEVGEQEAQLTRRRSELDDATKANTDAVTLLEARTAQSEARNKELTGLAVNLERRNQELADQTASLELRTADTNGAALAENAPDASTKTQWRHACHIAIGAFWAEFRMPDVPPDAKESVQGDTDDRYDVVTDAAPPDASVAGVEDSESQRDEDAGLADIESGVDASEEEYSQAIAMKAALAAARAELEAEDEPPTPTVIASAQPTAASAVPAPAASQSNARDCEMEVKPVTPAATPDSIDKAAVPTDLDPQTAVALRTLRRLNPTKSTEELLAQIAARKPEEVAATKARKGWFSRK